MTLRKMKSPSFLTPILVLIFMLLSSPRLTAQTPPNLSPIAPSPFCLSRTEAEECYECTLMNASLGDRLRAAQTPLPAYSFWTQPVMLVIEGALVFAAGAEAYHLTH